MRVRVSTIRTRLRSASSWRCWRTRLSKKSIAKRTTTLWFLESPNPLKLSRSTSKSRGSEQDKFVSVADLCVRTKATVGTSLYETSLARDKHK